MRVTEVRVERHPNLSGDLRIDHSGQGGLLSRQKSTSTGELQDIPYTPDFGVGFSVEHKTGLRGQQPGCVLGESLDGNIQIGGGTLEVGVWTTHLVIHNSTQRLRKFSGKFELPARNNMIVMNDQHEKRGQIFQE